jgi:DNA-binding transcriptional regulator YiaG
MEITMTKRRDVSTDKARGDILVREGQHRRRAIETILETYDATPHVGLRTIVCDAAIERVDADGEETIELPKQRQLRASAAVVRCLTPVKLRGWEIRAMRKILGLTLADLAKKLDERTAIETVSRWESDAQPMGGYAEKILRLHVCEELRKDAPAIEYNASMITALRLSDPWKADPDYDLPPVVLTLIKLKEQSSGSIIETWNDKQAA